MVVSLRLCLDDHKLVVKDYNNFIVGVDHSDQLRYFMASFKSQRNNNTEFFVLLLRWRL